MPIHIAMLRGINVSGHKPVKMELLRKSFEALGHREVRTYVQSGNVVFEARKTVDDGLVEEIQRRILRDFGFAVPVFLRTAKEMERIVRGNRFVKEAGIDESKLHVTFLSDQAPQTAQPDLEGLATRPERFRIQGREIYLYCPDGYGRTKLSNTAIEKKLGVSATTRNWRSVNALLAMV